MLVAALNGGRIPGIGGTPASSISFCICWCSAVSDWVLTEGAADGGVSEPLVGVRFWLASLELSDFSVLKLALDRRRSDFIESRLGAMVEDLSGGRL